MSPKVLKRLQKALAKLRDMEGADGAIIFLREGHGGPFLVRVHTSVPRKSLGDHCVSPAMNELGEKLESVLVFDTKKDPRFENSGLFRSALCVPIPEDRKTKAIGILYVFNTSKPTAFSYKDKAATEFLAAQLGKDLKLLNWSKGMSVPEEPKPKKPEPKKSRSKKSPHEKANSAADGSPPRFAPDSPMGVVYERLTDLWIEKPWAFPLGGVAALAVVGLMFMVLKSLFTGGPDPTVTPTAGLPIVAEATQAPIDDKPPPSGWLVISGTLADDDGEPLVLPEGGATVMMGKHGVVSPSVNTSWNGGFKLSCPAEDGLKQVRLKVRAPGYQALKVRVNIKDGRGDAGRLYLRKSKEIGFKKR